MKRKPYDGKDNDLMNRDISLTKEGLNRNVI